jgi:hypothetical protein
MTRIRPTQTLTRPDLRPVLVFALLICFGAASVASPAIALHQVLDHPESHTHDVSERADDHCVQGSGHAHGDHEHPVLEAAGSRATFRCDASAGGCAIAIAACFAPRTVSTGTSAAARSGAPPGLRHPLSITTILRI